MSARRRDINRWFTVENNPLSKAGVFPYLGRSIGAPEPGRVYMVLRPPEELGDPETVASFRLLPFVDEHVMLGPEAEGFMPAEDKGVHGVIGEQTYWDPEDETLYGNLKVWSEKLAWDLDPKNPDRKREISCGYRCVYDFTPGVYKGVRYDAVQRVLRGNHLALVQRGRMGPEVAVLDQFALDAQEVKGLDLMDPEMLAKLQAAAQAMLTVINGAMGGGGADTNSGAATTPGDAGNADTISGGEGKDTVAADAGEADTISGGDGNDTITADCGGDTMTGDSTMATDSGDNTISGGNGQDALNASEREELNRLRAEKAKTPAATGLDEAGVFAALQKRDALADRLKGHVGTFDHAGMTYEAVAAYGVEKLGLKEVPKGSEGVALDAALQAMGEPGKAVAGHAEDAAPKESFVTRHLKGADA